MFDELFDMFDRDRGRGREPGERRGIRGFFARLFGGGDRDDDVRSRYHDDEYDDRRDEGREASRRRRRDDDGFDFGD